MHLRQTCAVLALAVSAAAGAADRPWGSLSVADGQQLIDHFNASVYAKLWRHEALTDVRAALDDQLARFRQTTGNDAFALLADCRSLDVRFVGVTSTRLPQVVGQAVFARQAPAVFAVIKDAFTHPERFGAATANPPHVATTTVANADEAFVVVVPGMDEMTWTAARYAGTIVLSLDLEHPPAPRPPAHDDADIVFTTDAAAIREGLAGLQDATSSGVNVSALAPLYGGDCSSRLWIEPDGMRTHSEQRGYGDWLRQPDRSLFAHLPAATTVYASFFGLDGKRLWTLIHAVLPVVAAQMKVADADAVEAQIDQRLAAAGVPVRIREVVESLDGSCACAVTNISPFPGVTLVVPRSMPLDRVVEAVLRMMNLTAPQADGESATVTPPGLPIPIMLVRDVRQWVVTNDVSLASSWRKTAAGGGWADSLAGKATLATAPADAVMITGMDLAQVVRMAVPYASMALSQAPLPPARKQAITQFLVDLADQAKPECSHCVAKDGTLVIDNHGMIRGTVAGYAAVAIVAAIAIPNLLESRLTANEAAAAARLKSGIFPAEIQFQGGAYCDQDQDNVGEYGFIAEMSGGPVVGRERVDLHLQLVQGPLAVSDVANGYHYAIYLPDGGKGAIAAPTRGQARAANPAAADAQERFFVVYAWPEAMDQGRRVFALDQHGMVYAQRWDGGAPQWNSLYGPDGTWGGTPVWQPYRR